MKLDYFRRTTRVRPNGDKEHLAAGASTLLSLLSVPLAGGWDRQGRPMVVGKRDRKDDATKATGACVAHMQHYLTVEIITG